MPRAFFSDSFNELKYGQAEEKLEVGGDEKLIFNFIWPNVPLYSDCKFLHLICSLPAAVQFALFSELTRKCPLRGVPLANEGSDVVMAHVIYNQWVIRFVQQYVKYLGPPPRPPISATVEVTCSPPVQIINIVRQW